MAIAVFIILLGIVFLVNSLNGNIPGLVFGTTKFNVPGNST